MIKALAIKTTKDGKTEILHAGLKGDCLKIARAEGLKIKNLGDACVQVFSGSLFNDDGRKGDYLKRLEDQSKKEALEATKRGAAAKAKRVADLEKELADAKGEKPKEPAKKKAPEKAEK